MSDPIDRQEAIDLLLKWADGYSYIETPTEAAVEAFRKLPSVEPEIILCKDCQHYDLFNNGTNGMCMKHIDAMAVFYPWDFCSYGEGRQDATS